MSPWFSYVIPALFVALLGAAALSDLFRRKIPNWTVLALVGLYVVAAFTGVAPTGPWSALGAALIAFPISYGFYHFGIMGAGDAKLFTAASLFAGLAWLMQFAVITAMLGGVIAIGVLIVRPRRVFRGLTTAGRAEAATSGIPYGVPIALAAAAVGLLNHFLSFT